MAVRYVTNADGKGWLTVRFTNNSTYPPLPQYLKIDHQSTTNGRDFFRILEGRNKGKTASVKLKPNGKSYLVSGPSLHTGRASVKFNRRTGELWYGRSGPVTTTTMAANPVPLGMHDLEIPYEAHSLGAPYERQSIYAKTWFRIGHSGDRFLHPGRISAGCTTVTDIAAWTRIYQYLMKSRKGDGRSVGTIEVFI